VVSNDLITDLKMHCASVISDFSVSCNDCYEYYCDRNYDPFVTTILVTDALHLSCYL
jgi:hypothetical protein